MGLLDQTMFQVYYAFLSFALSSHLKLANSPPPPAHYLILMLGYFGEVFVLLGFSNTITLHSAQQNEGLANFARAKTGKF